jgi:DNA-binding response OmpR family regulator
MILIVEDDATTCMMLTERLEAERDFTVVVAGTLERATRLLQDSSIYIRAVILDIGMPDGDGRDFCRKLRQQGCKIPIIMLTGLGSESDIVRGLGAGADDYVSKPFRCNELVARLRAHLRAFENSENAVLMVGDYIFDPANRLLLDPAKKCRIRLTTKETQLLKYLHSSGGGPVAREKLLDQVWGYNPTMATHTLATHIYKLRRKIETDPARPTYLIFDRRGYRLDAAPRPPSS